MGVAKNTWSIKSQVESTRGFFLEMAYKTQFLFSETLVKTEERWKDHLECLTLLMHLISQQYLTRTCVGDTENPVTWNYILFRNLIIDNGIIEPTCSFK